MKNIVLIAFFLCAYTGISQTTSSEKEVKKTLQNYIEGSSYSKLDVLKSAFAESAILYLTSRGVFKRLTPEEYVGFFKNAEQGKFNGRHGKILSVEVTKDIAAAKVEIAMPKRKWKFIDLFLLKKTDKGWKIISKTATRVEDAQ